MRKLVFLQRSSSVAIKLLARILRLLGLHLNERNFTQTQHPCCDSSIPLQKQTMSHLFYSAHLSSSQCHFQITQNVTVTYFCVMFSGIQARCYSNVHRGQVIRKGCWNGCFEHQITDVSPTLPLPYPFSRINLHNFDQVCWLLTAGCLNSVKFI